MRNHLKTTCTNLSIYVLLHTKYVLEDIWYDQDWCRMKIKKIKPSEPPTAKYIECAGKGNTYD